MTLKEHRLIKARLAEVARKHEKREQSYTVYRHGKLAYEHRQAKHQHWLEDVMFVVIVACVVIVIINL